MSIRGLEPERGVALTINECQNAMLGLDIDAARPWPDSPTTATSRKGFLGPPRPVATTALS